MSLIALLILVYGETMFPNTITEAPAPIQVILSVLWMLAILGDINRLSYKG